MKPKSLILHRRDFLRAHGYFELKRGFNFTPFVDENVDFPKADEVKNDVDLWPMIEEDMTVCIRKSSGNSRAGWSRKQMGCSCLPGKDLYVSAEVR